MVAISHHAVKVQSTACILAVPSKQAGGKRRQVRITSLTVSSSPDHHKSGGQQKEGSILTASYMRAAKPHHTFNMMCFFISSSRCCFLMLLLLLHVVSSVEIITPHLSFSTDHVVGDDGDDASGLSSSLALSLRDIVQRHLQQEDSTTTATSTSTTSTSSTSSYSFLQLCHTISNLPNLECECTPLLEQWQEAQQERKELDEAYNVIFDKIELQKIKCESTSPVCSSSSSSETTSTSTTTARSSSNNNDNDVTCGRFTLDVVTANASHDLSSSISQTTMRSCVMYTRLPTGQEPYRDGCIQWEYYTTTATLSSMNQQGDEQEQQGTLLQVLEQENCHVSFMNLETETMVKCNTCQVCYTNVEKQRGMNVDCNNVEPAASTTATSAGIDTATTNASSTTSTCHVLDLDSFFPGFRLKQEYHQEQQQPQPQQNRPITSSSSASAWISLFIMASLLVSSMVMLW